MPLIRRRTNPRRGPLRSPDYRRWLSRVGYCEACRKAGMQGYDPFARIIDPAHTANNGMSSKGPDSSCAPLCRRHHREYDAGRAAFEAAYAIDMAALAVQWWADWQRRAVFQ